MKLTIVTPCSRPHNLPSMLPGIEAAAHCLGEVDWRIVFDPSVCQPVDMPGAKMEVVDVPGSRFGNGQRNAALDKINDGWIYFLDDDNLMHPDFCAGLIRAMRDEPSKLAFAFHQQVEPHNVRRAYPDEMRVNHIDIGQICIKRDLIGACRFQPHPYNADGQFIEVLYNTAPHAWGFIDRVMANYNALR